MRNSRGGKNEEHAQKLGTDRGLKTSMSRRLGVSKTTMRMGWSKTMRKGP